MSIAIKTDIENKIEQALDSIDQQVIARLTTMERQFNRQLKRLKKQEQTANQSSFGREVLIGILTGLAVVPIGIVMVFLCLT